MENIQVALRVRPLNKKELIRNDENVWEIPNTETVTLSNSKDFQARKATCNGRTKFYFDQCFNPVDDNLQVYQTVAKRVVLSSLNGINGTIFMYGQTGSGKTYTMMGYNKNEGDEHETSGHERGHERAGSPHSRSSSTPPLRHHSRKKSYAIEPEYYDSVDPHRPGNYIITESSGSTGILVIALRDIFDTIEHDMDKTYFLRCSYVEIYNDQIYDLLKSAERMNEVLTVNEDPNKDFYIKGVTEESVSSLEEILDKLKKGEANRHYARTTMNHTSSRSHTIFRLTVQSVTNNFIREYRREKSESRSNINNFELRSQFQENYDNNSSRTEGTIVTESLLNFVDLAGSEKVSNHQMLLEDPTLANVEQGGIYGRDSLMALNKMKERVKEGQHINKSLFFLTQVISLKSEGKSNQHIPYRNSPLTKILRSSLGGNSRTLIILCITPAGSQFEQSMSTLRFGMNAKKIENKVQANIVTRDDDVGLKILISDYEKKIKDYETARQEEQTRYNNLAKQVEELQLQKNTLLERFNSVCKARVTKMTENVPEEDLASFYRQVKDRYMYFDKVGVIFPCKSLRKYDNVAVSSSTNFCESPKIRGAKRFKESRYDNPEEEVNSDNSITSQNKGENEGKNKIEESLCKLYSRLLKSYKEQNALLVKKVNAFEKNMEAVSERSLKNYDGYIKAADKHKSYKNRLIEMTKDYKNEIARTTQLQKDLGLYKYLKGMKDLDDTELGNLEKNLWEKLDQVKMERAKRAVYKEMGITKDTNANTMNSVKEDSGVKSMNYLSTKELEIAKDFSSDEEEETSGSTNTEGQGSTSEETFEEKYEKEEKTIKQMLKEGIEDIDKELEINKKALIENKEIFPPSNDQEEERIGRPVATEPSEKAEKEASRFSSLPKPPLRKGSNSNYSSGQYSKTYAKGKVQEVSQSTAFPRLDLGASLSNFTIEPELPKLANTEAYASITSEKRIAQQQDGGNAKELEVEYSSVKSQKRGRSEVKQITNTYSMEEAESHETPIRKQEDNNVKQYQSAQPRPFSVESSHHKHSDLLEKDSLRLKNPVKSEVNKDSKESSRSNKIGGSEEKSCEKFPPSTCNVSQYNSGNNKDLSMLQSKLYKHLASLEKYFINPASGKRKVREIRPESTSMANAEALTQAIGESSSSPSRARNIKEEEEGKRRRLEEEFEMRLQNESQEIEYKSKKSVIDGDDTRRFKNIKEKSKPQIVEEVELYDCSQDHDNIGEIKGSTEAKELLPGCLNITNIEKDETMFSNSIFSVKEEGTVREKEYEQYMENHVLKQLDNILGKGEHGMELGDCLDFPINESKKRRKRADRLKKNEVIDN